MIGQLTFWLGSKRLTATLSENLQWQCNDPDVAQELTATFPGHASPDLSNLAVGRHLLYQTAERLGGRVEVPKRSAQKPELV